MSRKVSKPLTSGFLLEKNDARYKDVKVLHYAAGQATGAGFTKHS